MKSFEFEFEGRPAPNTIRLHRDNATVTARPAGVLAQVTVGDNTVMTTTLEKVVCEDSGTYTCEGDNGVAGQSHAKTVDVNVTCKYNHSLQIVY
jgi:hypothetical protein